VILPILIVGFPFKKTRGWLGKGFLQILSSAGFMMFIAILMTLAVLAFQTLIHKNPCLFGNDSKCEQELSERDAVNRVEQKQCIDKMCTQSQTRDSCIENCKKSYPVREAKGKSEGEKAYAGMSVTVVVLLLACFLLLKSVNIAQSLTSTLIGAGVSNAFQKKLEMVGKLVVDWITGGAVKIFKKVIAGGAAGGKDAGNKLGLDKGKEEDKGEEDGADAQVEQQGGGGEEK
jgi:hypothetical protein